MDMMNRKNLMFEFFSRISLQVSTHKNKYQINKGEKNLYQSYPVHPFLTEEQSNNSHLTTGIPL